jgi:hypothetical protein
VRCAVAQDDLARLLQRGAELPPRGPRQHGVLGVAHALTSLCRTGSTTERASPREPCAAEAHVRRRRVGRDRDASRRAVARAVVVAAQEAAALGDGRRAAGGTGACAAGRTRSRRAVCRGDHAVATSSQTFPVTSSSPKASAGRSRRGRAGTSAELHGNSPGKTTAGTSPRFVPPRVGRARPGPRVRRAPTPLAGSRTSRPGAVGPRVLRHHVDHRVLADRLRAGTWWDAPRRRPPPTTTTPRVPQVHGRAGAG